MTSGLKLAIAYCDGFSALLLSFDIIIANGRATVACRWFDPRRSPNATVPAAEFSFAVDMKKWQDIEQKLRLLQENYAITLTDAHTVTVFVEREDGVTYRRRFYGLGSNLYRDYPRLKGQVIEISQIVDFCYDRCRKLAIASRPPQPTKRSRRRSSR
ncbi:MAG: hypothetical protein AB4042_05060 [Leptolyngbyaceae cyanobacterium]